MNGNRKGIRTALTAVSAVVLSTVLFVVIKVHLASYIPRWVLWEESTIHDSLDLYEITLNNKTVSIKNDTDIIWTSPEGIKVQKVLSCDIDNDDTDELVLLCWKKGRYGAHKPFWVDEDEEGWSQHLFVYEYSPDKMRPKWMSSYIGQDIADITSNNNQAPDTRLWFRSPENEMSSWVWYSWGFVKEDSEVQFTVFGDILAHSPIYRYGLQNDTAFQFLFENVKDIIADSDVAAINQETPLVDKPEMYGDYPRFGTPVNIGQAIADAGFHVVTCATNHALDRGEYGVDFTKHFFDKNNIKCLGIQASDEKEDADKPYKLIRRNGVRFALFNYTYGTNGLKPPVEYPDMVSLFPSEDKAKKEIAAAKTESDFVIIFAHWGTEYTEEPDEFQKKWTQVFLESEADIVIGTHPHILQPYELLASESGHEMLVYYSIGNYISAQPEKSCIKGGMASFTISLTPTGYKLTQYSLQPLVITWYEGGKYTVKLVST